MKKYLAIVVAIMAISVLGAAGVVTGTNTVNPSVQPQQNSISPNTLQPSSTVQLEFQVWPPVILPKTKQVIFVTVYNTKNFDPFAYSAEAFTFGRTGTEAFPITQYASYVNGNKDLTLVFRAKDTGLTSADHQATLTCTILGGCKQNEPGPHCLAIFRMTLTGTAPVDVL